MKQSVSNTRLVPSGDYQPRNFTLRSDTARLLDRLPPEVNRSQLVDAAIQRLVKDRGRAQLRKLIAEEASGNAARDLRLVEEWFGQGLPWGRN